jgi:hypothetical protein
MNLKKLIKEVLEGNDCCSATKPTGAFPIAATLPSMMNRSCLASI